MERDEAYGVVQSAATVAWDEGASFRGSIEGDARVTDQLDPASLDALFDPARFLRNLGGVFDRLEKLPVEGT
jgi:adenylosuccinate lyase